MLLGTSSRKSRASAPFSCSLFFNCLSHRLVRFLSFCSAASSWSFLSRPVFSSLVLVGPPATSTQEMSLSYLPSLRGQHGTCWHDFQEFRVSWDLQRNFFWVRACPWDPPILLYRLPEPVICKSITKMLHMPSTTQALAFRSSDQSIL